FPFSRAAPKTVYDSLSEMFDNSSDFLSQILQDLRISGASYGRCTLTAPWGIDFPPQPEARFHFVVEGACWLRKGKDRPLALESGDVVLLPHGTGHALSHSSRGRTRRLDRLPHVEIGDRTYAVTEGGGGGRTILACCSVSFEEPA